MRAVYTGNSSSCGEATGCLLHAPSIQFFFVLLLLLLLF